MFDVFFIFNFQAYSFIKLSTSCIKWSKMEVKDCCQKKFAIAIPKFYIIIFAIEVHNLQMHR
jgi:hypothetical protein